MPTYSTLDEVYSALMANLPAAIWAAGTRTLTQSAASVAAVVAGSTITVTRGDSVSIALTGLGSLANATKIYFTVKARPEDLDVDAVIQIEQAGLLRINGEAGTAGHGSLTVTNAGTGALTVVLTAEESAKLPTHLSDALYDVQIIRSAGAPVSTLTTGAFVVVADVTKAIA